MIWILIRQLWVIACVEGSCLWRCFCWCRFRDAALPTGLLGAKEQWKLGEFKPQTLWDLKFESYKPQTITSCCIQGSKSNNIALTVPCCWIRSKDSASKSSRLYRDVAEEYSFGWHFSHRSLFPAVVCWSRCVGKREGPLYFLHSGLGVPPNLSQGVWWVSQHLPRGWELRGFVAGSCIVVIKPTIWWK